VPRPKEHFEQFMTPKEAAKIIAVSVKTIYKRIYEGKLPAFRISGNLRIKEADFRNYLKLNCLSV